MLQAGEKWNRRFAAATNPGNAASVLTSNLHLLPKNGHALDLACGLGANALLLAERGLQVEACDASSVALAKLCLFATRKQLTVATQSCDLENNWKAPRQYDVVVCSYYLQRSLCLELQSALRPGGLLFYQTFTRDKVSSKGPNCNEYLLEEGELLRLFKGLQPVFYREDGRYGELSSGQRNTASFIGAKH